MSISLLVKFPYLQRRPGECESTDVIVIFLKHQICFLLRESPTRTNCFRYVGDRQQTTKEDLVVMFRLKEDENIDSSFPCVAINLALGAS